MTKKQVWIVDDDESIAWVLNKTFMRDDLEVSVFDHAQAALANLAVAPPDVVFTDVRMPQMDGYVLLDKLKQSLPDLPIIIMTAYSDLESAISSYQAGAFEYLPKPFDIDEALLLLERALETTPPNMVDDGDKATIASIGTPELIGASAQMQDVFRLIGRLSSSSINVLIRGESGVGKELVARALHDSSPRKSKAFVEINTGAISVDLLESELFGHERGAFTGATQQRKGRFEQAHGGTLFLDEIGDMPADLQTRLLRVLSEKRFYRVGGTQQVEVDVRVIAATNQDLEARVESGQFRLDLFHRLNVVDIHVPSLRERSEDVALLVDKFLADAATEFAVSPKRLSNEALEQLMQHHWPGNVRELENLVRRLTVTCAGEQIEAADLPAQMEVQDQSNLAAYSISADWQGLLIRQIEDEFLQGKTDVAVGLQPQLDKLLIEAALSFTDGHKQKAAKLLGWGRNTLTRKLQELDKEAKNK